MVVGHATFAQEVILTSHISNNILEIVQQKQIIHGRNRNEALQKNR